MSATGVLVQVSRVVDHEQGRIAADVLAQLTRMRTAGVIVAFVDQLPQVQLEEMLVRLCAGTDVESVPCVGLDDDGKYVWPKAGQLLRAAAVSAMDIFSSWIIAADEKAFYAAAQAGFLGGIYIGEHMPKDNCGLQVLNQAQSLADAPRVMIPPQGGCWHDK